MTFNTVRIWTRGDEGSDIWIDRKAKLEQNGCLWSAGAMKEGLQGTRLERTWDLTMALNFIL